MTNPQSIWFLFLNYWHTVKCWHLLSVQFELEINLFSRHTMYYIHSARILTTQTNLYKLIYKINSRYKNIIHSSNWNNNKLWTRKWKFIFNLVRYFIDDPNTSGQMHIRELTPHFEKKIRKNCYNNF